MRIILFGGIKSIKNNLLFLKCKKINSVVLKKNGRPVWKTDVDKDKIKNFTVALRSTSYVTFNEQKIL